MRWEDRKRLYLRKRGYWEPSDYNLFISNEFSRWLLIIAAYVIPSHRFKRWCSAFMAKRILPRREEDGMWRSDVALVAAASLRAGDLAGFELWLSRSPFPERWQDFLGNELFEVNYNDSQGWHVYGRTKNQHFGKSMIRCKGSE